MSGHHRRALGGVDSFAPPTAAVADAVDDFDNLDEDPEFDDGDDDEGPEFDDDDPEDRAFLLPEECEEQAFADLGEDSEEAPAAGQRSVVLAGFLEGEAAAARALVDGAGFFDAAVLPAEGADALSLTVRDAILGVGLREPDWATPRSGGGGGRGGGAGREHLGPPPSGGAPVRAVLFGGLSPREQAAILDALESAGLPRLAVAEADELDWASRRVGDVLAEAAAEQGLLLAAGSSPRRGTGGRGGRQQEAEAEAAAAATASSGSAGASGPPRPYAFVDSLPDVEEAIREAERAAGGRIQMVEANERGERRGGGGGSGEGGGSGGGGGGAAAAAGAATRPAQTPSPTLPHPPTAWHAEAAAAGASLLDSLRDNIVRSAASDGAIEIEADAVEDDDDEEEEEEEKEKEEEEEEEDEEEEEEEEEDEEEATATLLDAVISGKSPASSLSSSSSTSSSSPAPPASDREEEEAYPLASYLEAVMAADTGPLPETDNSPLFKTKTKTKVLEAAAEEEADRSKGGKQRKKQEAVSPFEISRTRAKGFGSSGSRSSSRSSSSSRKGKQKKRGEEEEVKTAPSPSPPASSSSRSSPPSSSDSNQKPEPITIAPVGLEPDEVALHDRITEELDARFRAMPQADREALRERMREEAREPTRDAIVAAVACGLSFDEICGMAKVASDAAREAEEGLGVRWNEMSKMSLEPTEEEKRSAAERAALAAEEVEEE